MSIENCAHALIGHSSVSIRLRLPLTTFRVINYTSGSRDIIEYILQNSRVERIKTARGTCAALRAAASATRVRADAAVAEEASKDSPSRIGGEQPDATSIWN